MDTEHYIFTVFHVLMHVFHLAGKHMGHCHLNRSGEVDDSLVLRIRLPYVQNRVADLQRVLRLCLGEAFRAVLEGKVPFCGFRHLF